MSATDTDTTGTAGEDRFLRLLDDEGSRWRAGYQPPSFDDAVRRLALPGDEGAGLDDPHEAPDPVPAPTSAWWRPALVAAAALVLVGGVVGVAVRNGSVHGLPAGVPGAPVLTAPPAGFHLVDGAPAAGVLDSTAVPTDSSSSDATTVTYVGPRTLTDGGHETLVLTVTRAPQAPVDLPNDPDKGIAAGVLGLVRGHVATVRTGACADVPGCQSIVVEWAENADEGVTLSYAGPTGSIGGTLGFAEVMAAAESVDDGSGTSPEPGSTTGTGEAVLPREVELGGRRLQLWTTRALQGAELLRRAGGPTFLGSSTPAWGAGEISSCDPVDVPLLTAQDADHVEVTVGRYVTEVPTRTQLHPCPAVPPSQLLAPVRWVVLSDDLGGRRIVDGTTRRTILPMTLASGG